jgi:hypothetical protein
MAMKYTYAVLLILLCTAGTPEAFAQIKVSYETQDTSGVVIHADPRLAMLVKKRPVSTVRAGIYSTHGYRVQIYNGNDRAKATQVKLDFMRRFPGVRTYMTYVQPQFRVKVGDFRSRPDAQKMYQQVNSLYTPCMIVPDIVEINNVSRKDD